MENPIENLYLFLHFHSNTDMLVFHLFMVRLYIIYLYLPHLFIHAKIFFSPLKTNDKFERLHSYHSL